MKEDVTKAYKHTERLLQSMQFRAGFHDTCFLFRVFLNQFRAGSARLECASCLPGRWLIGRLVCSAPISGIDLCCWRLVCSAPFSGIDLCYAVRDLSAVHLSAALTYAVGDLSAVHLSAGTNLQNRQEQQKKAYTDIQQKVPLRAQHKDHRKRDRPQLTTTTTTRKTTAPRIPAWSPTVVLTRRHSG